MTEACYRRTGPGAFESQAPARGAWVPGEQHLAAASGLVIEELTRVPVDGAPKRVARIALDILGTIHEGPFEIATSVVRPGRRIELVEAVLTSRGRPTIVARAWRLAETDTSAVVGIEDEPMPGPPEAGEEMRLDMWPDGYVQHVEYRALPGRRPGRNRVWLRPTVALVEGETESQLAHLLRLADVANGVATRVDPSGPVSYPNVDLQLHLYRDPVGEWFGLDTAQTFGPTGTGLTSSVMHDLDGPFGRIEQTLVLLPRTDA